MSYKDLQKEFRLKAKALNHGKVIVCSNCGLGGEKGPLLKINAEYKHKMC